MISKMQNKNLPEDERLSVTPDVAELLFTTDDKKLYVGDGTTHGGILISDNAFITEDMTLNVPADYASLGGSITAIYAANGGFVQNTGTMPSNISPPLHTFGNHAAYIRN